MTQPHRLPCVCVAEYGVAVHDRLCPQHVPAPSTEDPSSRRHLVRVGERHLSFPTALAAVRWAKSANPLDVRAQDPGRSLGGGDNAERSLTWCRIVAAVGRVPLGDRRVFVAKAFGVPRLPGVQGLSFSNAKVGRHLGMSRYAVEIAVERAEDCLAADLRRVGIVEA